MKKNKMMRLASGLLVAVLITTSTISGTFAKYVTEAEAGDTARVAKFGVVVTANGTLFDTTYVEEAEDNVPGTQKPGAAITVESSNGDNLVAPGTKNEEGITFAITGTPEVDVNVAVTVDNVKDIFLAQKTGLPNMTTGLDTDTFDNGADYYPVKYTLTSTVLGTMVNGGTMADVETALAAINNTYEANTNLATEVGTLKLTWAWDFDDAGAGTYDKQDTLLGDLAAGTTLTPATTLTAGTDYSLNTEVKINITVTQVD
ncbi:MAG: hypothetical protein IKA10_06105 [Oscillospiraceae bacterium]|nr:hypothetical protein [Oscillospiraceae bacterium]